MATDPISIVNRVQQTPLQQTTTHNLFNMMMLDFTAILVGYNLPRKEAKRLASKAVNPVREYFATTDAVLRRARL